MDFANILKNVEKHIRLSRSEVKFFTSLLAGKDVHRKGLIVTEGQPCRCIHYVDQGAFRAFAIDNTGNERAIMFAIDDWWITDIHGFVKEKPALMSVQALEKSSIFQLQKSDLDKLYHKVPKFERFFRILMQNAYIREQLRTKENLTDRAEERYEQFVAKYPHLIQRIPLKEVASYLGITPQFLSVIRRRLKKRN